MSMDSGTDFKIMLSILICLLNLYTENFYFFPQKMFWKSVLNALQIREDY